MPAVASYAPRGQSRRRRVQHFRNDNWPPRPPAQNLPVPSFLGSPDSEMLRALPTPSFVTPVEQPQREPEPEPEPEVKAAPSVPTKAVIAASAVPLADWFADVVWALYLGPTQTGGGNSGLAGADKAPQPLAAFVHAVLSQTLASPQCAALGLYYLVRLPVRLGSASVRIAAPLWNVGVDAEGHTCYASVQDRERAARAAFVAELYGPGGEDVPYRLAALALMLGNKWLDDHTFTNKTWHEVTHLSLARLTALEQRALECFNYSLGVANPDWRAWLGVLKEGAVGASAAITTSAASILGASAASMGVTVESNATSLLAVEVMERLEKEHEVLTGGVGAGVVDVFAKGVIGDRRQAPPAQPPVAAPQPMGVPMPAPASASEMELDELEMEQVEIDIDLDDGGPVPDELRRPVKMRLGAKGVWGEDKWEVKQETKKQGEDDQRELKELKDQEKGQWEEDEWDDEWERAVRAAGGDRREDWLMGIVEDGEDRYAHDRLAREERDYWIRPNGWDRAVQRPSDKFPAKVPFPSKTMYPGDKAVQRPSGKKELFVDEPRVELYDARLRCDSRPYYPTKAYGYEMREFPSKPYPKGSYEYSKQGVYEYPQKGVYYPSYEPGCVYDLGPDATAGFDYGCPYSYVPRQVPPPTWSNSCVLS